MVVAPSSCVSYAWTFRSGSVVYLPLNPSFYSCVPLCCCKILPKRMEWILSYQNNAYVQEFLKFTTLLLYQNAFSSSTRKYIQLFNNYEILSSYNGMVQQYMHFFLLIWPPFFRSVFLISHPCPPPLLRGSSPCSPPSSPSPSSVRSLSCYFMNPQ